MDAREAVFIISVAARLVDMHPSTLRKYERCGLLEPCRQGGRLRLYSPEDIGRLRQIKTLVEEKGVNLAGVELALALTERVERLRRLVADNTESDDGAVRLAQRVHALTEEMFQILGLDEGTDESDGSKRRSGRSDTARGSER